MALLHVAVLVSLQDLNGEFCLKKMSVGIFARNFHIAWKLGLGLDNNQNYSGSKL